MSYYLRQKLFMNFQIVRYWILVNYVNVTVGETESLCQPNADDDSDRNDFDDNDFICRDDKKCNFISCRPHHITHIHYNRYNMPL